MFWVLVGEDLPVLCAAAGSSTATAVNWMLNFLVSLVFLTVVNAIGQGARAGHRTEQYNAIATLASFLVPGDR